MLNISSLQRRRVAALTLAVAGGLSLASCMTATPYQPAMGAGPARSGYSDEQVESNRFRVTFSGNTLTSRETVERYLLYRAAELTVQSGNDYFVLSDRDTEKHSQTYASPSFGPGPWGGFWGPTWRYYRPRWGWGFYDPWFDGPGWGNDVDIRTVERYEATAEIVVGKGAKPDNVRAFDAHDVIARLGPKIELPKAK